MHGVSRRFHQGGVVGIALGGLFMGGQQILQPKSLGGLGVPEGGAIGGFQYQARIIRFFDGIPGRHGGNPAAVFFDAGKHILNRFFFDKGPGAVMNQYGLAIGGEGPQAAEGGRLPVRAAGHDFIGGKAVLGKGGGKEILLACTGNQHDFIHQAGKSLKAFHHGGHAIHLQQGFIALCAHARAAAAAENQGGGNHESSSVSSRITVS